MKILTSGIALSTETIADVVDVSLFVGLTVKDIDLIRNKEVKIALYDSYSITPEDPIEFLRYAVFKATDKTLLIKNPATFKEIKGKTNNNIIALFNRYETQWGIKGLASIFYRFKPLFLAFRTNGQMKRLVNKIRREAVEYHKPMQQDFLNDVTAMIKTGTVDDKKLKEALEKANTFRKVRLAYALKFRTIPAESIMYRIRNGKSYSTTFNSLCNRDEAERVLDIVKESIVKDLAENVKGKKIYIPENITYALPATEKMFTGDFPSGSYISLPKDMVFGITWNNVGQHRIDIDLSLMSIDGKYGWDRSWRNDEATILFSGDMTDAAHGACECFYVRRTTPNTYLMMANFFNSYDNLEVPYNIFVAREEVKEMKLNYMVNPNNISAISKSKIVGGDTTRQKILGIVTTTPDETRFYFAETAQGKSISSSNNKQTRQSREYLRDFYTYSINLNSMLKEAGAKMVTTPEKADIDLSPENMEKQKIISLLA
jgi:hypothetical protein